MKILMDTHIALWALSDDPKLPLVAKRLVSDMFNDVYVSAVSVWEVAIKHALHPDMMLVDAKHFAELCEKAGYKSLEMRVRHACELEILPPNKKFPQHKDPFDRMLIAQSKSEQMMLLTHDAKLANYEESTILFV